MRSITRDDEQTLGCVKTDEVTDTYMPKAELMVYLQNGVDQMVKNGTMPAGALVTDIRVREVAFLVKRPSDGLCREIIARIVPEGEMQARLDQYEAPSAKQ